MNASELNKKLQEVIKKNLPEGISIANFLMDNLQTGKEATYRRLRGEVPFSLYEAALITKRLGISLDYIIGTTLGENPVFELIPQHYYNLREEDYKSFKAFKDVLKVIAQEPESEFVVSSNVFPQIPAHVSYLLCKYNSFKWIYQNQDLNAVKPFHEIDYPEHIHLMHKDTIYQTMNIKKSCYIWDNMIFSSVVKEINYFSSIYLINKEDVKKLKEELHNLLYYMENIAEKGVFDTGNKVDIYVSDIISDAAYSYIETNHISVSMIGAFVLNYLVSYDRKALERVKERMNSLKRVSTLISGSGELYRLSFFNKQHEIVDTL